MRGRTLEKMTCVAVSIYFPNRPLQGAGLRFVLRMNLAPPTEPSFDHHEVLSLRPLPCRRSVGPGQRHIPLVAQQ